MRVRSCLILVAALLLMVERAPAAMWSVPGDFASINAAIAAAAPGDEVHIAPGTYTENIVLDEIQNVRVFGLETGTAQVVIAPASGDAVRMVDSTNVEIGDVHIAGAGLQHGIRIKSSSGVNVFGVNIEGSKTGIRVDKSQEVSIDDVEILHTKKDGIRAKGVSGLLVDGTLVQFSAKGPGIRILNSTDVEVDSSTSSDNAKEGMYIKKSPGAAVTDSHAVDNIKGDGVRLSGCPEAVVSNTFSWGNGRSGIRIDKSPELHVHGNSTAENAQYGIRLKKSPPLTVDDLITHLNLEGNNGIAPFRVD